MTNTKYLAVVFDKDGVLSDSEGLKAEAWDRTLRTYSAGGAKRWYLENLGPDALTLAKNAVARFALKVDPSDLASRWHDEFASVESDALPIHQNLKLLRELSQHVLIGVASSMSRASIEQELRRFGYRDAVAEIASGEEVVSNKPAPDVYLDIIQRLGVSPDQCLAIEDSPTGIDAATRAGLTCIAYADPRCLQRTDSADCAHSNLRHCRKLSGILGLS